VGLSLQFKPNFDLLNTLFVVNEQRAKGKGQKAIGNGQWAMGKQSRLLVNIKYSTK
jgi:hypothetical protein